MLLQECYKCGTILDVDKQNIITLTINENGERKIKDFCQRCVEAMKNDQNNSNLLLG